MIHIISCLVDVDSLLDCLIPPVLSPQGWLSTVDDSPIDVSVCYDGEWLKQKVVGWRRRDHLRFKIVAFLQLGLHVLSDLGKEDFDLLWRPFETPGENRQADALKPFVQSDELSDPSFSQPLFRGPVT